MRSVCETQWEVFHHGDTEARRRAGEEIGIVQAVKVLREGFLSSFYPPMVAVIVIPIFIRHSVFYCVCVVNLPSSLRCEMHTLRTRKGAGISGESG